MSTADLPDLLPPSVPPLQSAWRWLLQNRLAFVCLTIILFFVLAAVFAESLAPYDPQRLGWGNDNRPPAWVQSGLKPGTPEHLLGTDRLGRDMLSRLLYGTRTAMFIGLLAAPLAALLGLLVGGAAGFYGGALDLWLVRLMDVFGAFPAIMFSVLAVLVLRDTWFGDVGGGLLTLALAYALIAWVGMARLIRTAVLVLRQELYVEAARSVGAPSLRILFRHILPNCLGLALVWLSAAIPRAIILEALLGYIGLRVTKTIDATTFYVTSWGGMFFDGRGALSSNPTLLIAPAVCVALIAASFTLLSDLLRDQLDPRLRND